MKVLRESKTASINIPFTEILAQMPKYAKFLKGLLSNKTRLEEAYTVTMNERCSAVLLNKLPPKEKDPGSFTIPCDIGNLHINNALSDLGASISLMPYTMYEKLGLREAKPTRISLELADRSIQYPRGIAKNVLIKVDKFILPIDFVILYMREDSRFLIILGRPFLATARAMIDVFNKKITLRIGNEETDSFLLNDLEKYIDQTDSESCEEYTDSEKPIRCIEQLDTAYLKSQGTQGSGKTINEHLCSASAREIDEKKPELKNLPSHLEYAYLKGIKLILVIISSKLIKKEKVSLLQVLEKHEGAIAQKMSDIKGINMSFCVISAIAWKMSGIKGICLSFCMHKILMEESFKLVIQPQRRLNPRVQDVVKNKIVRLLNPGLIYPISDSPWVSPIHVIPKKGGTIVVLNDNNELIPSCTVTGWRVCIDDRKLNDATRKYHFPLPSIDQMLERLSGNEYYCFLDGFSGFFQILIAPEDQEKTMFTCPYGTFAYQRMPFGLCNAPATFQRCMTAIFHDMVEDFMDVFSVFGNSFNQCLGNLDKMLARCEETNLVLNWEKCHFMVKEAVLGQRIDEKFKPIYYASKTLNDAQAHYTTTEKELLAVVFSFDKFRPYLILSKTIVYTDHSALKYLFSKQDVKPRLIRWVLLLQGFNIEIKDKRGAENMAADHLSRLKNPNMGILTEKEIADEFPDEHLMILKATLDDDEPWYADYVNYIVGKVIPPKWSRKRK
ncbi:reverse transcriptase domain-containing protein [Tanacetum coccineum]